LYIRGVSFRKVFNCVAVTGDAVKLAGWVVDMFLKFLEGFFYCVFPSVYVIKMQELKEKKVLIFKKEKPF
jgi:hypothetical protein